MLFATFPAQPGDLTAQLEAYGIALEGHDRRDIAAAVRRFIRGEVDGHNQSFPPTASKLGGVTRSCMIERLDAERRQRLKTPALPPPDVRKTPEQRARVKAVLEEVSANLEKMSLRERGFDVGDPDWDAA